MSFAVRILDLSGANGSDPLEVVRGFATEADATTFARRYVRDSIERCRTSGMCTDALRDLWFAFGEDAEVEGGWKSAPELPGFFETPASAGARDWRALDPRRRGEPDDE